MDIALFICFNKQWKSRWNGRYSLSIGHWPSLISLFRLFEPKSQAFIGNSSFILTLDICIEGDPFSSSDSIESSIDIRQPKTNLLYQSQVYVCVCVCDIFPLNIPNLNIIFPFNFQSTGDMSIQSRSLYYSMSGSVLQNRSLSSKMFQYNWLKWTDENHTKIWWNNNGR